MIQRRKIIGGFSVLFAVASAPASAQHLLVHDRQVTEAIEILEESWAELPLGAHQYAYADRAYRVLARCGNLSKYGTCVLTEEAYQDLDVRASIRAEAMTMLRLLFKEGKS